MMNDDMARRSAAALLAAASLLGCGQKAGVAEDTRAPAKERARRGRAAFERIVPEQAVVEVDPAAAEAARAWKPAKGPLFTRWGKTLAAEKVHQEYPRPQMVRREWLCLNGLWDYAIRPRGDEKAGRFDGKTLVPFAAESALSGVMKKVLPEQRLWYRRTFTVPAGWKGRRVLLHFGAVDWHAVVWLNGTKLGEHKGGYDPFSFDVTDALKDAGPQEVVLAVWDPTDRGPQPRGKQVLKPGGIMYTAVTGIWQTVWLEPVPASSIDGLVTVPDIDEGVLRLTATARGAAEGSTVEAAAYAEGRKVASAKGAVGSAVELSIAEPKLWSPDEPFLYDLDVKLSRGGAELDRVQSYFGMRKIALGRDEKGVNRLFLNNAALFQIGPLDQGWWPDGLYTAPTDEALRYDIEVLKSAGMNMMRKHVKVEPGRFYYWCDRLGLLVWQDMASGSNRGDEARRQFGVELKAMVDTFRNHPSIVMWVPFNEGWGQHDTERITKWTKDYDPSRLVNNASGWTDKGVGDVHDVHSYPGPGMPKLEESRAAVLGEFGGLGLPLEGHVWRKKGSWGYRSYKERDALAESYDGLMRRLHSLIGKGLAAAVYTQTTDVEVEVNGLMTYDREVLKIDAERLKEMHDRLFLPPPVTKVIVATSEESGLAWRRVTTKPGDGWEKPGFDDSAWKEGPGGFGTQGTPGTVVRTVWRGPGIWIRRAFELAAVPNEPLLRIHHDEDAEVYVNGVLAAKLTGYTTDYVEVRMRAPAREALKVGGNLFAVHCHQTGGGQYIDVGIVEVVSRGGK